MPGKWTKKKINNEKKKEAAPLSISLPSSSRLSFSYSFFDVPTSAGQRFPFELSIYPHLTTSVGRRLPLSLCFSLLVPWPVSSKLFEVSTHHSIFIPAPFFKFHIFFLFLSKTWVPIHDWHRCVRGRKKSMGSFDMVVGVGMSLYLE